MLCKFLNFEKPVLKGSTIGRSIILGEKTRDVRGPLHKQRLCKRFMYNVHMYISMLVLKYEVF